MKYSIKTGLLALVTLVATAVFAQNKSAGEVKQMIESKNFIFKAEYVNPQSGRSMFLTSSYDLTVRPGEVISYLPYFGRAYSAPVNTEGGIKFTSSRFDFNPQRGKKGKWEISIKPHDVTDIQELNLTVFENGRASLNVTSTNRQYISFTGYVVEGKTDKKAF